MKAIKFTLSGKTAFFKKPEVNAYFYFTYGQIHKMTLLGIFGAILGYDGYAQKGWKSKEKKAKLVAEVPEFYEKLKGIRISVVPQNENGYISKKVQVFNNSVGYASKEQGGNLIIKEQWLENPKWDIYVCLEGEVEECLAEKLLANEYVYIPYLGKNDHLADITGVEMVELRETSKKEILLSSLFIKEMGELSDEVDEGAKMDFRYEEQLPVGIDEMTNLYICKSFVFTNYIMEEVTGMVFDANGKKIMFY